MLDFFTNLFKMLWGNAGATWNKIGTVLIDRRFWLVVIGVVTALFGIPKLAENQEMLSDQFAQSAALIIQGITIIVGMVKLIDSWENRPPSGTRYNENAQVVELLKYMKENGLDKK